MGQIESLTAEAYAQGKRAGYSLCKTCKHWKSVAHPGTRRGVKDEAAAGPRRLAEEFYGHVVRYCWNPKVLINQRPFVDTASVHNASYYSASLVTGPDFGCTLHETTDGVVIKE